MKTLYKGSAGFIHDLPVPDYIDVRVLAANTEEQHDVPSTVKFVVFSSTGDFWCRINRSTTAITIPAADITDGSAPELNPTVRNVEGQTKIHLIASSAMKIVMVFYA